jgi:hypothetical protein
MTARRPCPPAPGPLEAYAAHFDALFHARAQRQAFRTYLAGLLAPCAGLAGPGPLAAAVLARMLGTAPAARTRRPH